MNNQTTLTPKLIIALTLYLTSLFASNTLGAKLMPFLWGTQLSVAVFSFPLVFITTDVIGEVYGKKTARMFVLAGAASMIVFIFYNVISILLPWGERSLWMQNSYNDIYGISVRFSIASLLAYIIGEYQDVLTFFFFKNNTGIGGKYFWIRSNLSNIWSQFLDTTIFMLIAFWGTYPFWTIFLIIIPWWLYKVMIGFLYTPLSYIGIRLLKDK